MAADPDDRVDGRAFRSEVQHPLEETAGAASPTLSGSPLATANRRENRDMSVRVGSSFMLLEPVTKLEARSKRRAKKDSGELFHGLAIFSEIFSERAFFDGPCRCQAGQGLLAPTCASGC